MPKAFYNGIELKPLDMPIGYSGRPVLAFVTDAEERSFGVTDYAFVRSRICESKFKTVGGNTWKYAYQLPDSFEFTTTPDKPKKIPHTYKDLRDKIAMDEYGQFFLFVARFKHHEWTMPIKKSQVTVRKFCSTWEQADKGEWTDIIFAEDCE